MSARLFVINTFRCLQSATQVSLEAEQDLSIKELKQHVQTVLAIGKGRLFDVSGNVLDDALTIEKAGLQNGDRLTWQMSKA